MVFNDAVVVPSLCTHMDGGRAITPPRKWLEGEADAEEREDAATKKRRVEEEVAERKWLTTEAATKMREEAAAKKMRFAKEAAEQCHGDVALFNFMARLPMISKFWPIGVLANHINDDPNWPLLQGNQYGTCLLKQGGELFDANMVSNQDLVDGG